MKTPPYEEWINRINHGELLTFTLEDFTQLLNASFIIDKALRCTVRIEGKLVFVQGVIPYPQSLVQVFIQDMNEEKEKEKKTVVHFFHGIPVILDDDMPEGRITLKDNKGNLQMI